MMKRIVAAVFVLVVLVACKPFGGGGQGQQVEIGTACTQVRGQAQVCK
jgi:hypothetical protein